MLGVAEHLLQPRQALEIAPRDIVVGHGDGAVKLHALLRHEARAPGDIGFPVWRTMGGIVGTAICNDRRWPETYRVMGLQGVEMVLLGYNTPEHNPPAPEHDPLSDFHNHLSMQAGAYQNGTWVVGVAKAGVEEGCMLIGGSAIIAPSGEIVAQAVSRDDELIVARCDFDRTVAYKTSIFNFAAHRRPEAYGPITQRAGVILPPEDEA